MFYYPLYPVFTNKDDLSVIVIININSKNVKFLYHKDKIQQLDEQNITLNILSYGITSTDKVTYCVAIVDNQAME